MSTEIISKSLSGIILLKPQRFNDQRGFFSELWSQRNLSEVGIDINFLQENHSFSHNAGTIRGLHSQSPPYAQTKLVRCGKGRFFDVAVDIRIGSPTYGQWVGEELSFENGKQLLKGVEKADSLTVDPHKWFYQPYEMGCLLVRNHKWLSGTFTEVPEYLKDVEGNSSEINFYDHGIQLTRRFRALKFYMSIKTFGLKAFREAVQYNFDLCEKVESILAKLGYED